MTCSGTGHVVFDGSKRVIAEVELTTEQFATSASNTAITDELSPARRYVTLVVLDDN